MLEELAWFRRNYATCRRRIVAGLRESELLEENGTNSLGAVILVAQETDGGEKTRDFRVVEADWKDVFSFL